MQLDNDAPAPAAGADSGTESTGTEDVSERLASVEAELAELRAAHDALLNESLASWLVVVGEENRILAQVYSTLSWRITKPLRVARQVQLRVSQVGVGETASLVSARLRQRARRKA